MSQRLALFIGTALVAGLGYFALNKNDKDDTEYDTDDSDEEPDKSSDTKGGSSWWDNFTSSNDEANIDVNSLAKPTRRKVGGNGNGAKSKKQRPSTNKKTRNSRKY